jgi:hypothetical protein
MITALVALAISAALLVLATATWAAVSVVRSRIAEKEFGSMWLSDVLIALHPYEVIAV